MDQFFTFEDPAVSAGGAASAIHPGYHFQAATYGLDIDQVLAQAAVEEEAFHPLQHQHQYPAPFTDVSGPGYTVTLQQPESWEVAEQNYYSQWNPNSYMVSSRTPCDACERQNLQCQVMRDTSTGLSNTSFACIRCISSSQPCSLDGQHIRHLQPSPGHLSSMHAWPTDAALNTSELDRSQRLTPEIQTFSSLSPSPDSHSRENSDGSVKTGARFSRETVKILKHWLISHSKHPYPTEQEKEELKRKTGLSKIQITNWLANARRRGIAKGGRGISPLPNSSSSALKVPRIGEDNKPLQEMDPLERWQHEPPEHEPATIKDIANAFNCASLQIEPSPDSYMGTEETSSRSHNRDSSADSLETATTGSVHSSYSHRSRSVGPFNKRGRRRRRQTVRPIETQARNAVRQYQCTFCVESFKTKHDWQRHEKSLHLSLERWLCAPHGSSVVRKPSNISICVFCGAAKPNKAHMETHNYTSCLERSQEERTFYRKDHLRQHLRLVHDCKLSPSSIDAWRVAIPNVRSRCGFCNLEMNSWASRVDHLAEHFKAGKTMADWTGEWGFEEEIQKLVENSTPPYLIYTKRLPLPLATAPDDVCFLGPYETLKKGLLTYITCQQDLGRTVSNDELRGEACRIGMGITISGVPLIAVNSWFRDIMIAPGDEGWLADMRQKASGNLRANANINMTEDGAMIGTFCALEDLLTEYVRKQQALGISPTDIELRTEGCRLLIHYDAEHSNTEFASGIAWFCRMIMDNKYWLKAFRKRVGLPPSDSMTSESHRPTDTSLDASIHTSLRLENELKAWLANMEANGTVVSDSDIQAEARNIIFSSSDPWNQTPADDPVFLARFKESYARTKAQTVNVHPSSQQRFASSSTSSTSSSHTANANASITLKTTPTATISLNELSAALSAHLSNFLAASLMATPSNTDPRVPTDDEFKTEAQYLVRLYSAPWDKGWDWKIFFMAWKARMGISPAACGKGRNVLAGKMKGLGGEQGPGMVGIVEGGMGGSAGVALPNMMLVDPELGQDGAAHSWVSGMGVRTGTGSWGDVGGVGSAML